MHPNSHIHAPALFSLVRITSFLTCLLVALASGTNYVYSAYAPQLGARLHLSHTQSNVIGLSGNVGVYGTSPIWGRIVDTRGPRSLLAMGFFALLIGYSGIRYLYNAGIPAGSTDISRVTLGVLVFFGFLTGAGGNGGLSSAINTTAKSFPDRARATVNGIVISGFGLSAFLFSTIAHVIFPGDTSTFLLVLAVGTSLPMVLGFFLVRPIPLPHSITVEDAAEDAFGEEPSAGSPVVFERENDSHTHLLAGHHAHGANEHEDDEDEDQGGEHETLAMEEEEPLSASAHLHHASTSSDYLVPGGMDSLVLSPTGGQSRHRSRSSLSASQGSMKNAAARMRGGLPNVFGKALFISQDFWLLFTIMSLLSGTGLMYINNVGSISQALFAKGNPEFDEVKAAQWQATQVSTVSIMNCLGRISIGIIADLTKSQLGLPRSFCIALVAALFIVSQAACYSIVDVSNLWKASALLGFAYGGLFGIFPTIVIEWFGLAHFSENWGFVSLSPMLGGNIFSIAFGQNLDAHAPSDTDVSPSSAGLPSAHQCFDGRACYVDSLKMTIAACCVAFALGVYAGWRDRRKQSRGALKAAVAEILWVEDED